MNYIELDGVKIEKEKLRQIIKDHPELVNKPSEWRYFFPKPWEEAWEYNEYGSVSLDHIRRDTQLNQKLLSMWVFKTKEQAEREIEKQKAKVRIRKYVQENWLYREPDWSDDGVPQRFVKYNHKHHYFYVDWCCSMQTQAELPYFIYDQPAKQAIKACEKDYLIYFGVF